MLRNQQKSGLCLPRIAALIDWSVVPDAVSGPLRTDKLVPVRLRDGIEQWLLIHSAGMRRTSFGHTGLVVSAALVRGRRRLVVGLCHELGPHGCDGLGGLGARCSGVLVLGSGNRAWAISSFGSADSLDFNSGPGKENGEPPLGRLPVNRTRAV